VTRRKIDLAAIELAQWPDVDATNLGEGAREVFEAREHMVRLYVAGVPLAAIEEGSGIGRKQLYRLMDRCLDQHEDGRLFGFRGLLRYRHTQAYRRRSPILAAKLTGQGGAAGAFSALVDAYPTLQDWLHKKVKERAVQVEQLSTDGELRIRLRGLGALHNAFLTECRKLGLTGADYPFNTHQLGCRSLSAALKAEILRSFGRAARTAGASHLKGLPRNDGLAAPAPRRVLDVVEFDGHRLDVRLKIVVRDPLGFEQQFEIERIWLLVIIDVFSRAVLGYHVSLNREYNRHDIIRTVENALAPHRPRAFTVPGIAYGAYDGFPSSRFSELGYAAWTWIKMDNAKANLADDVRHAMTEFLGGFVDVGPAYTPDDRPYIERFFGSVAANLSARLPGYTGASPKDLRRALADPKGNLRLFVSLTELEDLLEAALAAYNGTGHYGLNGRTPLEAIEHSLRDPGTVLTWLPEHQRRSLCLMQTPKQATVRGYLAQGQRCHVNFYSVRYTNAELAATASFLGKEVKLYYNSQDLRTVRAIALDGTDLGILKAQGAWGEIVHDLTLRQEILKLRGRKKRQAAVSQDFIERFVQDKIAKAKGSRRAASSVARTLRALAAAPTETTLATKPAPVAPIPPERPASVPAATPKKIVPQVLTERSRPVAPPKQKIEPQILAIGPGYAGDIL
jgi:putative transposase